MSDTWIQDAIKYWESDNTDLSQGSDLKSIIHLEKETGIKLTAHFKELESYGTLLNYLFHRFFCRIQFCTEN